MAFSSGQCNVSRLELNSFNEIVMTVAGVGKVSVSDLILINELQRMEWRAFIGFQHVLVRCLSITKNGPLAFSPRSILSNDERPFRWQIFRVIGMGQKI